MNKLIRGWIDNGWILIGVSALFWIICFSRFNKGLELGNYFYLAIGFLIIGLIQLIIKHQLK